MEPQERELITTLLTRLQSAGGQPKDPEADAMIRQAMTQMPDASYYLVQTVLIQDLSLHNAQNRIEELERQAASQSAPQPRTSFLGGLLGGGNQAPQQGSVPSSGPWTRAGQAAPPPPQYAQPGYAAQPGYPPPGYAQPAAASAGGMFGGGGNSFLRSAATTAAGVAGGALLFQGISSLFGHSFAGGLGGFGGMGGMGMGGGLGETVINNYNGGGSGGGDYGAGGASSSDSSGGGGGGYDSGGGGGGYDAGGGGGYDGGGGGGGGDYDGGGGGGFDGGGGGGGGDISC